MRGVAAAATASKLLPSLHIFNRYASPSMSFAFAARSCPRSIRTSFASAGSALLLPQRAASSQTEPFSLGWTGDQQSPSADHKDSGSVRQQAQQTTSLASLVKLVAATPVHALSGYDTAVLLRQFARLQDTGELPWARSSRIKAVDSLVAHMSSLMQTCRPIDASTAMWAVTKLNAAPHVFLQQCAAAVLRDVHAASDQDVATVSWAIGCAKGQHGLADILKQLEPAACSRLSSLRSQSLALLCWGFSASQVPVPHLMLLLPHHILPSLSSRSIAMVAWAASKQTALLRLHSHGEAAHSSALLVARLALQAAPQAASMMPRDVALLAWSVAHTAAICPELRILVQTAPFLEAVYNWSAANASQLSGLDTVHVVWVLCGTFSRLPAPLISALRTALDPGLGFGSMSHDEQSPFTPHAAAVIAAALTRIGLRSPDALLLSLLDIVARGHSSGRSSSSDLCLAALAACTAAVPPDHPIFDAASKAAPSDAADVTRLLTAIVRVRHREAAHVVKKTKVSLLPLLPHANENQLGQLAQAVAQVGALFEQDTADAFAAAALNRRHSWMQHSDAAFQLALALVGASAKSKDLSAALEHLGKGCLAAIDAVRPLWSCVALVLGFSEANARCDYLLRRVVDVALQRPLELPSHTIVALVRVFSKLDGVADSRDRVRVEKLVATCVLRFRELEVQDFAALVDTQRVSSLPVLRKLLLQYLCSAMPTVSAPVLIRMLEEFVSVSESSSFDALWQQLFALLQNRRSLQWSSSNLADICFSLYSCSARVSSGEHVTAFAFACSKYLIGEVSQCSDSSLCSAISLCEALGWPHDLVGAIGGEAAKRSQHVAVSGVTDEELVAVMSRHVMLHRVAAHQPNAIEKAEVPQLRASNQRWSPRNSVVK